MTARVTVIAVVFVGVAGCVSYRGGARAIDPTRLTAERGWVVAAPTPALRQRGSHDCGAASLAMIARRWHVPLSVAGATAALPATPPQGSRLGDLRDVARSRGLQAFAIAGDHATLLHELRAGRPVIVGLVLPNGSGPAQSHYEVVVALQPADGKVVTIDPAAGWVARRWVDFDAAWRPGGRPSLVVLGPKPRGL